MSLEPTPAITHTFTKASRTISSPYKHLSPSHIFTSASCTSSPHKDPSPSHTFITSSCTTRSSYKHLSPSHTFTTASLTTSSPHKDPSQSHTFTKASLTTSSPYKHLSQSHTFTKASRTSSPYKHLSQSHTFTKLVIKHTQRMDAHQRPVSNLFIFFISLQHSLIEPAFIISARASILSISHSQSHPAIFKQSK